MATNVTVPARSLRAPGPAVRRARRPARPRRHAGDLLRVGLGLAVLGLGFLAARQGQLTVFERDAFRIVNDLPPLILPAVWLVMQLGNVVAVPVLAAVAAAFRRFALSRDLLVSGVLAYVTADLVKSVVGRERPAGLPVGTVFHEGATAGGAGFVSGHSAVAAALATAAAPYLSRRGRRVVWALAVLVGLSRIYVGAHLPLDVIGGLALGWALGSLVHWLLGVPPWEPAAADVAALLERFGLPARQVRPAATAARSSHPFVGVGADGRRLFVKMLDPDPFDRDWLYRLARLLAFRDVKDADALAPLARQAEHEAVANLTAAARGVRVPAVLLARGAGAHALVVQEQVEGARPLDALGPGEFGSGLLRRVFDQVALLHAARVAHRDLVASNVLVAADGSPWIVDFGNAETGADDEALGADVAELMASLALLADPRAVAAVAVDRLGDDAVVAALPALAPLALSSATRTGLRAHRGRLSALRAELHRLLGLPNPDAPALPSPGAAAAAAATGAAALLFLGVAAVTGAAGEVEAVELNGWRWLGAALALAVLARAAAATAAVAVVHQRLAVGRTYGAHLAAEGAALLHGRAGSRTAASRYLERAGLRPGTAERALTRTAWGATVAAALVATAAMVLAQLGGRLGSLQAPESALPLAAVGVGASLLLVAGHRLAAQPLPAATEPAGRAGPAGLGGRGTVALLGWAAAAIALDGAALGAALHAVDGDVPLLATASAYVVLRLLWSVLPAAGTPGVADVTLVLALSAFGAPLASAGAGVLLFRLLTFWGPAALGALLAARFEHRLLL